MRTIATSFQTTTNYSASLLVPARTNLWGVQITGSLDGQVGTSYAYLQASLNSVFDESVTMSGVLARMNLQAWTTTTYFTPSNVLYVPFPKPFVVASNSNLYFHTIVSGGSTGRFACIFYLE